MRQLGNGRWDRILIRKMLELSEADTWEEAKEEWKATGDVWWGSSNSAPEWVVNSGHRGQCLCGHRVVYHFRIVNMENGNEEVVGSDHITAYLVLRHLADERGVHISTLTEADADEWIKSHVADMKAEAWFAENGEMFNQYFEKVKLLDQQENAKIVGWVYDRSLNRSVAKYKPIKKGSGTFGHRNYQMASIVWRWNALENPKRQSLTRGYPNDKLWADLIYFANTCDAKLKRFNEQLAEQAERRREVARQRAESEERRRQQQIAWEAGREERERKAAEERQRRIAAEKRQKIRAHKRKNMRIHNYWKQHSDTLLQMCDYYGVPPLDGIVCVNSTEQNTILFIYECMVLGNNIGTSNLRGLERMMGSFSTTKQRELLDNLLTKEIISKSEHKDIQTRMQAQKMIAQHLGELDYECGALNTENKVEETRESD